MDEITPELIRQAANGHIPSCEHLFRVYSPAVFSVAYRMLNQREDAEDVTQSVFVKVYSKLRDFRFEASIKTWIHRITINETLNKLKKTTRERENIDCFSKTHSEDSSKNNVDICVEREYRQQVIQGLLNLLSPEYRTCMILRNVEKFSYQEIADTTQVNINTVKSRLKRAREILLAHKTEVMNNEL
ncbi:MAG: RNA polymerase sigma factor [Candidatus Riflebacteria bacterium]|nr:RNA polymerase sigma factor [Candidatus Riflebacteria bacterium]